MSHHAKASSAGSIDGGGRGRGRFRRIPLALLSAFVLIAVVVLSAALASAAAPVVTVDPAGELGFSSVKAEGSVNPGEKETSCHFEFLTDKQFNDNVDNGDPGFANAAGADCANPLTGNAPVAVSANLENLTSGTTYHLRLVASNEDGTEIALAPNFTTQTATAPVLTLDAPGSVSYTKAHISGTIDPEGGNVNPVGGPAPISWALETNSQGTWEFREGGTIEGAAAESTSPITVEKDLEGLSPATNFKFRLRAIYTGREAIKAGGEFTTLVVSQPVVAANDAAPVTGTTAHFSGTVTAGGTDPAFDSSCTFDYVTDKQFLIDGFASAQPIACVPPTVTGTSSTLVAADAAGLEPNTVYHLRLRAENAGGQSTAPAANTFSTEKIAPVIVSTFPNDVTTTSATLNAQIKPGGDATTYHFEYMTLAAYEDAGETFAGATSTPESASIGADGLPHLASANISGLQPNTAYRFRVVATNVKSPVGGTAGAVSGFLTWLTPSGEADPDVTDVTVPVADQHIVIQRRPTAGSMPGRAR